MTTPHSIDQLVRTKRRWLVNLWLSGLLLALAIVLGLGVTLWRLQETMELVDDSTLSEAAYEQMVAKSVTAGRAGLAIGTLAFLGYLISMLMHLSLIHI